MKENRIAITGSHGFIGSWLSAFLPDATRYDLKNFNDIRMKVVQQSVCADTDTIIHLAAISGIKDCEKDNIVATNTNTKATFDLASMAKEKGVKKFIFASTSAVYGETTEYSINEDHANNPRNVYGKTKLEAESILDLADKDFTVVIFRKSNVYGYGTVWKEKIVVDAFISRYLSKLPLNIAGDGLQRRNFVHIQDIVNLYIKVARGGYRSGIYNIGGDETISINDLAKLVNQIGISIFGYDIPVKHEDTDTPTAWHDFRYDDSKARMEFAYKPAFDLKGYIQERMFLAKRVEVRHA